MKKIKYLSIVAILLVATGLFASQGFEVYFNQPSSSEYELNYILGEHKIAETVKNGATYSKIEFEGSVVTTKKGYAELPFIHASVQLSNDRNVTMEIVSTDYVEYTLDYPLLPSRGIIYRNQDPSTIPHEISDESIIDEFYPKDIAEATEPFILRDIRGTKVYVYPFQYNAARNILRVYTNVTVKLTDNNTMPINPITSFSRTIMRDMHNMYSTIFINYDRTRFENELTDFGSILVIHTPRDATAILPYIEWKREKGHTVYVEEVATATNVISLVSSQYTVHNDILYVQIVGDWEDISGATLGGDPADPNLGCVVGGDIYMDLIVGRFSANSAAHVTTQVNKTITYERDPDMGAGWYEAAVGIASNEGAGIGDDGESDFQHMDVIWNDKLDPFTYDIYTPIYAPSANATMVANAVNTGTSIINYCGHGSTTSWVTSGFNNTHVNLLTNSEKLPFITSVACVNGNFGGGECFAEAWLKKDDGGAIGMFASSQNQSWAPPMIGQDYIIDLLIGGYDYSQHPGQNGITTDIQKTTYGSMCFNGTILMSMEDPGGGPTEMAKWHVFGDAALQVRTDTPAEIVLSNNVVLMGIDFTTNITTAGSPVEGALVSLFQDGASYTGLTDENGDVTISHELEAGDAKLTVTAFNTETIYEDISVIPPSGPYLMVTGFEVNDDNNNIPEYNEIITLDVTFENVGIEEALNVNATLSTEDTYVNISSNYVNIGDIPAGESVTIQDAFEIEVADGIPDQHMITFDVEMVGIETWYSNINIIFSAPDFEIGDMIITDSGGDGILDPGETATVSIPLTNIGNATSQDIFAQLINGTPDIITVIEDYCDLTGLAPEEVGYAEFDIEVDAGAQPGDLAILSFIATSGAYNVSSTFYPSIGLIVEDFETGDFSNYPWQFSGNADWTIDTNAYEGNYCAKSGTINHNQTTSIILTLNVLCDNEISFYRKTSCEDVGSSTGNYYDYLAFFIDGEEMDKWAGETPWGLVTFEVSTGNHTFEWMYHKDVAVVGGQDCVWVDYILFPPFEPEVSTDDMSVIPSITKLNGNYPNPFNPTTTISYSLKEDSKVTLEIFNIKGQKVRTLVKENQLAGHHKVVWNGKDENSKPVASGIYFYKMKAGNYTSTKKMILMKQQTLKNLT